MSDGKAESQARGKDQANKVRRGAEPLTEARSCARVRAPARGELKVSIAFHPCAAASMVGLFNVNVDSYDVSLACLFQVLSPNVL